MASSMAIASLVVGRHREQKLQGSKLQVFGNTPRPEMPPITLLGKKSVKTNDSAFLPRNGYHSLLWVFNILHDLPLDVALRSEAKLLTQRETSDQL